METERILIIVTAIVTLSSQQLYQMHQWRFLQFLLVQILTMKILLVLWKLVPSQQRLADGVVGPKTLNQCQRAHYRLLYDYIIITKLSCCFGFVCVLKFVHRLCHIRGVLMVWGGGTAIGVGAEIRVWQSVQIVENCFSAWIAETGSMSMLCMYSFSCIKMF